MTPPFLPTSLISAILGITAHLTYFIHADLEKHVVFLANCLILWPLLGLIALFILGYRDISQWIGPAILSFHFSLLASIAIYRYFFHALDGFPGPKLARITALWDFKNTVLDAKWYIKVKELHGVYGDVVRIKPREVSINDPSAIKDIYGVGTTCVKGPFYDLHYPHRSLQMARDKAFHSKRRRLWDRGFTSKALAGYEPYLLEHCKDIVRVIESRSSQAQEATALIDGFAWDSMGIFAFGKSFNMLHGEPPKMLQMMRMMGRGASALLSSSWLVILMRGMVGVRRFTDRWLEWCAQCVEERSRVETDRRDLFSYLIEESISEGDQSIGGVDGDLVRDSELAITAGSDTAASTLNALFYLLARHPEKLRRLQEEIDSAVPACEELSHAALVKKPYLEGCINESLRLCPAVLSGLQRETGPEGLRTAGVYIPPGMIVSVPTYTVQRGRSSTFPVKIRADFFHEDPRNFPRPGEFIPERWSTQPELVIHKEALNAFSSGTYSCAGKAFAMMEMRLLVSTIAASGQAGNTVKAGVSTKELNLSSTNSV
ncbi:tryprostatin B 6-hydroxylase [Aspergillus awamori]|uniref:Tryprostatin B 6-hydroxylase n=1 Tax=Aspergillus awamori TaxID=105351 RepID=A0A401KM45_ASPAW|nr:tryprostatin B 6-hydroxylase [Aspergillus awamori]